MILKKLKIQKSGLTILDELPELFNILKGDIDVVANIPFKEIFAIYTKLRRKKVYFNVIRNVFSSTPE